MLWHCLLAAKKFFWPIKVLLQIKPTVSSEMKYAGLKNLDVSDRWVAIKILVYFGVCIFGIVKI